MGGQLEIGSSRHLSGGVRLYYAFLVPSSKRAKMLGQNHFLELTHDFVAVLSFLHPILICRVAN